MWLRFEPVPTEEQPDPDKVAVGVRAAARAASPHLATAEDQAGEEVDVPPEDPVQPASTQQLGSAPVLTAPVSADEALLAGPPDPVPPPAVTDPMTSAERASPVPSASPASPESPASPDSPPPTVADPDR